MKIERWGVLMGLLFFSVVSVNILLIIFAATSYGGMLDQHPYARGLEYNATLKEIETFQNSGWTVELSIDPLTVTILSDQRELIRNAEVEVRAIRPNNAEMDQELGPKEIQPGVYRAEGSLMAGRWLIDIVISQSGVRYRIHTDSVVGEAPHVLKFKG